MVQSSPHVVCAGEQITGYNQRRFRSDIESAATKSYVVIADLTQTRRVDRWGYLTLFDLHERLKPRLVLVVPETIRRAIGRLDAQGTVPMFSSVDEVLALVDH